MIRATIMTQRRSQPEITDEERSLFRSEMDGVAPVRHATRRLPRRRLPSDRPRSTEADEAAVMDELLDDDPEEMDTGEQLYFARAGIQHAVMRRLRRGQYSCQDQLDLHGLFVDVARKRTARFLLESRKAGYRCVRIIHGKGLRSGNRGPVLRNKVTGWLRQRDEVLAYCSARRVDGGTGAVYVLLRR